MLQAMDFENKTSCVHLLDPVQITRRFGQTGVRSISENIVKYGYSPEDFYKARVAWEDLIHPDDLEVYTQQLEACRGQNLHEFVLTYRIVTQSCQIVLVQDYVTCWGLETCITKQIIAEQMHTPSESTFSKDYKRISETLKQLYVDESGEELKIILEGVCPYAQVNSAVVYEDSQDNSTGMVLSEWYRQENQTQADIFLSYSSMEGFEDQMYTQGWYVDLSQLDTKEITAAFPLYLDRQERYGVVVFRYQKPPGDADAAMECLEYAVKILAVVLRKRVRSNDLRAAQAKIYRLASYDYLTGLPNRHHFERVIKRAIRRGKTENRKGYVLLVDVDNLKLLNKAYGHSIGDLFLKKYADYLLSAFGGKDNVFRFGDDEFVLLLEPERTYLIQEIIDKIQKRSKYPWNFGNQRFYCTVSVGIVAYPVFGSTSQDLLRNLESALSHAKNQGKNQYAYYNDKIENISAEQMEMEQYMRDTVYNGFSGFDVYFQPVVKLPGMEIIGAEALLRWKDKKGDFVSPGRFIPLAEQLGLIVPLGYYVLRRAVSMCKEINERGFPNFTISVNVSVQQLLQSDFPQQVIQILGEVGVNFGNVIIEITEDMPIHDLPHTNAILGILRGRGIKIAIDDFGTGYSSLSYLRDMAIDHIKIDRAFICDIDQNQYAQTFIRLIAELGHSIGKEICIEGVETQAQMYYCTQAQADYIQGHLYYKAMEKQKLEAVIYGET